MFSTRDLRSPSALEANKYFLARQLTNRRMSFLKTVIWKKNYAEKDLFEKSASGWIPSQEMSHPSEYCISASEVRVIVQQISKQSIYRVHSIFIPYRLIELRVVSNLIGSLSRANQRYPQPCEWMT